METCHYCGMTHHPMPVYQLTDRINPDNKPRIIHVCLYRFDETGEVVESDCYKKAIEDGYKFRRDLTPRR